MTNEELLADLKQFIEATVSQQVAHLATKEELADIKRNMATKEDIKLLDEKLDTIQGGIADTLTNTTESLDIKTQDHGQRIQIEESPRLRL